MKNEMLKRDLEHQLRLKFSDQLWCYWLHRDLWDQLHGELWHQLSVPLNELRIQLNKE